jgi:hypothetical protein
MRDLQRLEPRLLAGAMALLLVGCSEPRRMIPLADVGYQPYSRNAGTRDGGYARRSTAPTYRTASRQNYSPRAYSAQAYRDPRVYSRYDDVATGGVPAYGTSGYAPDWRTRPPAGPYNAPADYGAASAYGSVRGYDGSDYGQAGGYAPGWSPTPAQPYPRQPYPVPEYSVSTYPAQAYPAQSYQTQTYQPYPPRPYPVYPQQAYPSQGYPSQGYPQQAYPPQAYPAQPAYAPQPTYYANPPYGGTAPYDGRRTYPDASENGGNTSSYSATASTLNGRPDPTVQRRPLPRSLETTSSVQPVAALPVPRPATLQAQAVAADQGRPSPVASAPLAEKRRPVAEERRETAPARAGAPQPRPAAYRPQTRTASLGKAQAETIRFLPIIGAPATVITPLARQLANAARAERVVIKASTDDSTNHILKGYLAAFRNGDGVTVSYVWDVLDKSGERLHRIQGRQDVAYAGGDLWAAVPGRTLQTIAEETLRAYGQWQRAQRG